MCASCGALSSALANHMLQPCYMPANLLELAVGEQPVCSAHYSALASRQTARLSHAIALHGQYPEDYVALQ